MNPELKELVELIYNLVHSGHLRHFNSDNEEDEREIARRLATKILEWKERKEMPSKSVWDLNEERKEKFGTKNNNYSDFPVGSRVKIICICQDFNFFDGTEIGEVISNSMKYLGIIVRFDEPRHFEDGSIQRSFNFAPDDLVLIKPINPEPNKELEDRITEVVYIPVQHRKSARDVAKAVVDFLTTHYNAVPRDKGER